MAPEDGLQRAVSDIEAWLFDLDGVLTDTARVHAAAWKLAFDDVLSRHVADQNGAFQAFDEVEDYERYVDGKPRSDGVRDFLASRGLTLAEGRSEDGPDTETVHGVGNRKNALVLERLADHVTVFPGSVALVKRLRAAGRRTAVVSASENCSAVLEAAHIAELFDVSVDGRVARHEHLRGNRPPTPSSTPHHCSGSSRLAAPSSRTPPRGVTAGHAGRFGLVIGVARRASPAALTEAGADMVVGDLGDLLDIAPGR